VLKLKEQTIIDELTAVATVLFMTSCLFSFLSLRSRNEVRSTRFERVADVVFLGGLFLLFGTTMLISFNLIQ
jgi:threonine/homoserine/homoserine lactone efflux protein